MNDFGIDEETLIMGVSTVVYKTLKRRYSDGQITSDQFINGLEKLAEDGYLQKIDKTVLDLGEVSLLKAVIEKIENRTRKDIH